MVDCCLTGSLFSCQLGSGAVPADLRDQVGKASIDGNQGAVQDHIGQPICLGTVQRLVQIRGLSCQDVDPLGDVAVGRGAGDAVVAAEFRDVVLALEPAQD